MIKTCRRCGKEFDGHSCRLYCDDCRPQVLRDQARARRQRQTKRQLAMTKDDIRRLLNALRAAHNAGFAFMIYGGQSFLTDEQLAVVEAKYPDHTKTLRDQREQKFRDAVDNFIKLYRQFERLKHD